MIPCRRACRDMLGWTESRGCAKTKCDACLARFAQAAMPEVWLRTNRRALTTMVGPSAMLLGGFLAGVVWSLATHQSWFILAMCGLFVVMLLWLFAGLTSAMFQPRVAYQNGELLAYLEFGRPTRVPI